MKKVAVIILYVTAAASAEPQFFPNYPDYSDYGEPVLTYSEPDSGSSSVAVPEGYVKLPDNLQQRGYGQQESEQSGNLGGSMDYGGDINIQMTLT